MTRIAFALLLLAGSVNAQECTPGYCTNGDADTWADAWDNCVTVSNQSQLDADHDGYGNACDADVNQSGLVTVRDVTLIRNALNTADPVADLDGSGLVTAADVTLARNLLNTRPGPAALALVATGVGVYQMIRCIDCAHFDAADNTQYLKGTAVAGARCWPMPPTQIPTGIPDAVWGWSEPESGGFTACRAP